MSKRFTSAALMTLALLLASEGTAAQKARPARAAAANKARPVPASAAEPAAETPDSKPAPGSQPDLHRPGGDGERPWARQVPLDDQQAAEAVFREANALLKESIFVRAAAKYREALARWDHPAIHYNLVLALLNLDQPLDVHEHLTAAMKYGPAPLDEDKFEQARRYKNLVEKQLATVHISCDVPGAQVRMDGRPLFVAPGKYEGYVRAGPHTIVASLDGYLTNEISRALPAAEKTRIEMKLFQASDLTQYRRRWSNWIPWTVTAAGAAVLLAGGGLHYGAATSFSQLDDEVAACAPTDPLQRGGCSPRPEWDALRSRGTTLQNVAFGAYAAGGAALIGGSVLLYMNRLQPYQLAPDGTEKKPVAQALELSPFLGGGTRGVQALVRF